MGPIGPVIGEQLAAVVVREAFDEIRGRSGKRWALVLIGLVVGAAIAGWVIRQRQSSVPDDLAEDGTTAQVRRA